jgi:hypothetical protein
MRGSSMMQCGGLFPEMTIRDRSFDPERTYSFILNRLCPPLRTRCPCTLNGLPGVCLCYGRAERLDGFIAVQGRKGAGLPGRQVNERYRLGWRAAQHFARFVITRKNCLLKLPHLTWAKA